MSSLKVKFRILTFVLDLLNLSLPSPEDIKFICGIRIWDEPGLKWTVFSQSRRYLVRVNGHWSKWTVYNQNGRSEILIAEDLEEVDRPEDKLDGRSSKVIGWFITHFDPLLTTSTQKTILYRLGPSNSMRTTIRFGARPDSQRLTLGSLKSSSESSRSFNVEIFQSVL